MTTRQGQDNFLPQNNSSSHSITEKSIQAERFIPQYKRLQWDSIPPIILISPALPVSTRNSASHILRQWVYHTDKRKSALDTCTFNILHYIYNCANYLNHCLDQQICGVILPQVLHRHSEFIGRMYHEIQQNIVHVKLLQSKLENAAASGGGGGGGGGANGEQDEDKNKHDRSCYNYHDRFMSSSSSSPPSSSTVNDTQTSQQDRIIQTTPEKLARICDDVEFAMEKSLASKEGITYGFERLLKLHQCLQLTCRDYLSKMHMVMDVERLQAMQDVQSYDLYSCQFDCIEIPPPQRPDVQCLGCCRMVGSSGPPNRHVGMNGSSSSSRGSSSGSRYCAYHSNLTYALHYRGDDTFPILEKSQGKSKASIVSTREQFINLPRHLFMLSNSSSSSSSSSTPSKHDKRVIAYLTVSGVAENRPLVCVGDLVRLRFGGAGAGGRSGGEEVIGVVGGVTVKTESVMLILPVDELQRCPEYLNALKYPKNRETVEMEINPTTGQSGSGGGGRLDVRFGMYGSRAHDIFKEISMDACGRKMDQVMRVLAPTHFLDGVQKKTPTSKRLEMMMEWMNDLNQEQKQAVMEIVWKQHGEAPYCIYGPPGTGKTTTVVESIVQVLKCNPQSRILVCAPSDAACDVVAMRLLSVLPPRFKMLRVNWWARNSSSLPPSLLSCSPMDEEGFFDMPCKEQIQQADVVICQCFVAGFLDIDVTMHTCNEGPWMENHFTHAFIDESSQSFEYESLIPLLKLGRGCSIILAGDPKQLGPTARSKCASRNGLSMSLQERLMGLPLYRDQSNFCTVTKLLDNYRSHKALLRVPSELFYDGSLRCKATPEITSTCKDFELLRNGAHFPMMAYDVSDGTERSKIDTPSFFNLEECHAIVKIIKSLLSSPNVHIHAGQIAVITCFRAQVLKLRNILRAEGLPSINVGVVEDFQGQETSVVLISTVLTREHERWKSGAKSGLGFMTDPKKFNVAITRASALCVIVGKIAFLENSGSYWSALMEHIRKNGGISGDSNAPKEEEEDYDDLVDYGIGELISRIEDLKILGAGYEMDRYMLAMRGYYEDSPEWRVCL